MTTCPKCDGRGTFEATAIVCARGGTSTIEHGHRACLTCDATGLITEARLADVRAGEAARADRVHGRHRSLSEEAAVLGLTPQELSKFENYGITPEAWASSAPSAPASSAGDALAADAARAGSPVQSSPATPAMTRQPASGATDPRVLPGGSSSPQQPEASPARADQQLARRTR